MLHRNYCHTACSSPWRCSSDRLCRTSERCFASCHRRDGLYRRNCPCQRCSLVQHSGHCGAFSRLAALGDRDVGRDGGGEARDGWLACPPVAHDGLDLASRARRPGRRARRHQCHGACAQLVAAHVGERGAAASAIETQTATLDSRIAVQQHTVDDLDRRVRQIDSAIEEAARRGKINVSLSAMEGQRRARAALVEEHKREAATSW
jgi:hypothetical protein